MNLLLDTHVVLWVLTDDPTIARPAREAIGDGANRVLVSAVSAWEITIKKSLGKLRAPDDLIGQLAAHRLEALAITVPHALGLGELPSLHSDPFDRLLVSQARAEGLTLVTRDTNIRRYDVATLDA